MKLRHIIARMFFVVVIVWWYFQHYCRKCGHFWHYPASLDGGLWIISRESLWRNMFDLLQCAMQVHTLSERKPKLAVVWWHRRAVDWILVRSLLHYRIINRTVYTSCCLYVSSIVCNTLSVRMHAKMVNACHSVQHLHWCINSCIRYLTAAYKLKFQYLHVRYMFTHHSHICFVKRDSSSRLYNCPITRHNVPAINSSRS